MDLLGLRESQTENRENSHRREVTLCGFHVRSSTFTASTTTIIALNIVAIVIPLPTISIALSNPISYNKTNFDFGMGPHFRPFFQKTSSIYAPLLVVALNSKFRQGFLVRDFTFMVEGSQRLARCLFVITEKHPQVTYTLLLRVPRLTVINALSLVAQSLSYRIGLAIYMPMYYFFPNK
uniref:Uncharacterized protein n=1 Tax=Solanum lycopersicum TaxID=4081 RepID=A0A3Q7HZY4_SOLLC